MRKKIIKKIIAISVGALKKSGFVLLLFALSFVFSLSSFANIKGSSKGCLKVFQPEKPMPKNIAELGLFVSRGLRFTRGQKVFGDLYRNMFLENPLNTSKGITEVQDLLDRYPGLSKPSFREQELSLKVKRYLVSKELSSFIQSFTKTMEKEDGFFFKLKRASSLVKSFKSIKSKRQLQPF